ncbi:ATP synthase mitochondrial F1 complex assembly factor 2 [Chlorella sorokiniana]|uniref:ATP synthase mitochondrial F1 complex assembly factor 2 n=1 Tax=Chlorella sorokiniana TaxID=3076 RepID=A0A2P6U052_CHLSO|nr:ATP synthase mitochondrial F1 complex assembly factor 2 [Chlorella sorokiniana]|eukprot:PRW59691.1 ATP synthase mitochondrial F1 complex assembly factor 2 [Chlorella sorokiniana]
MQALRQAQQLGLARPLTNLRDLLHCGGLPSLLTCAAAQRAAYATHGVGEGGSTDGVPRFYKTVQVQEAYDEGGFQILLDHRVLRTPARNALVVPSRALAYAIAAEWEWQIKRIQPFTMPLMSLAATALDQPKPREEVIATMLQYLPTDSVICHDEPGALADRQKQLYAPVLQWAQRVMGIRLEPTNSIFGATLGEQTLVAVEKHLQGLDRWQLAAAEQLAACCKSVLLGLAATAGELSIQQVLSAARAEEDLQIEQWGLVEGGHDIDIADLKVRVAAPALFVRLLRRY